MSVDKRQTAPFENNEETLGLIDALFSGIHGLGCLSIVHDAVYDLVDGGDVRRSDLSPHAARKYVPQLAERHGIETIGIFTGRVCGKEQSCQSK